jgi:hypothetical protein
MSKKRASPRAGKEGGRQLVHLQARFLKPRLDLVGQRKQPFHSAHDFLLFGEHTLPVSPIAAESEAHDIVELNDRPPMRKLVVHAPLFRL